MSKRFDLGDSGDGLFREPAEDVSSVQDDGPLPEPKEVQEGSLSIPEQPIYREPVEYIDVEESLTSTLGRPTHHKYLLGAKMRLHVETVDGTEYVKDAYGGFGPGSPEYDNGRRLEVVVPNAKQAVRWFEDVTIEEGKLFAFKVFSAEVARTDHPMVSAVSIKFKKFPDNTLIVGKIEPRLGAFGHIEGVPKTDEEGREVKTYRPAQKLLFEHLETRISTLYPESVKTDKTSSEIKVTIGDDVAIYIDTSNLPNLSVGVNGRDDGIEAERYNLKNTTPGQLARELTIMQEHFPGIAEAYADFFRVQLPKTTIEVDYKSPQSSEEDEKGSEHAERISRLRQELVVDPREDDFKYIGGLDKDIERLHQAALGFAHPEAFEEFGVTPPRGILLKGPPGTGKTSLAMAFANDVKAVVLNVKASTIKNAFHGETEKNVRAVFDLADELAAEGERVVIFMDEIESLAPQRNSMGSSNIDRNVVTELLQGMNVDRPNCIIIAATNDSGMVDSALTNNSSRFSEQLEIGLPNEAAREDIIKKLFLKFSDKAKGGETALFETDIDIAALVQGSEELSGADIENAIRKVLMAKAVMKASTGQQPGPVTETQLYSSLDQVFKAKQSTGTSYL